MTPETILIVLSQITPALLTYMCLQCDGVFTALIYPTTDGPKLAIFPKGRGSLATPHTPSSVRYYLNQVQGCWSVGANSAAISMYRVALDHLLFEQGFTEGMVGKKLENLEKAITAGEAPKWARDIDPKYMGVLNKLATYALHPNDGNVDQQTVFDQNLLIAVKATFQTLLFQVYELPEQDKERMQGLESALKNLKEPNTRE